MKQREWQVGDIVRIRDDLIAGHPFMGIHIFADQAELFGTVGKVREIDGDAVRVGRWWWHRSALMLQEVLDPEERVWIKADIIENLHNRIDLLREEVDLLQRKVDTLQLENETLKSELEGAA